MPDEFDIEPGTFLGDPNLAVQIPGSPVGNISVRQNNPVGLKYAGQPGARLGARGFAAFNTPEEGYEAARHQVELYKGNNYTLAQGAEKWYRNPNTTQAEVDAYVRDIAKLTGHSPNTPMANIPTDTFTDALSKRESGAKVAHGEPEPGTFLGEAEPATSGGFANLISPVTGELGGSFGDTRPHGPHHAGDIYPSGGAGTPFVAPTDLTVIAPWKGGANMRSNDWGVLLKDDAGNEYKMIHVAGVENLKPGQKFKAGEQIGVVGGVIDKPHLHMQVMDRQGNPIDWISQIGASRGTKFAQAAAMAGHIGAGEPEPGTFLGGPAPASQEGAIKTGVKKGMLDWATSAARAVDPASAMTGMGIWPEADNPVWNAPATREARAKVANQVVGNALFPNGVPPGREDTLGWLTENVARLWPQFVMLGTLGGYSAPAELISSSVMKGITSGAIPFSMLGLLEEDPLKGAAAGGALGGALGMLHGFTEPFSSLVAKWLTRVAGGGAIGYTSARLEGAEPEEAGRNALLFGLFELFGMRRGEDKVRAADVVPPGLKDELVELAEKAQEIRRQQYIPGTPEWVRARALERGYPGDWLEEPHTWKEITPVDPTTGKAVVEPGRPTPTPFSEDIMRRASEEREAIIQREFGELEIDKADREAAAAEKIRQLNEQASLQGLSDEETKAFVNQEAARMGAPGGPDPLGPKPPYTMYSAGPDPAIEGARKDVSERYGIDPEQLKYIGTYKDLAQFDVTDPRSPRFKSTLSAKLSKVETPAYAAEKAPIWYSKMGRFLQSKLPGKGSGGGLADLINGWASKGEFKPDELKWSGLIPWLQEQKGTITKQDVVDYLNSPEHRVEIEEVMKRDIKEHKEHPSVAYEVQDRVGDWFFSESRVEAEDYARRHGGEVVERPWVDIEEHLEGPTETKFSQYVLPGGENYREMLLRVPIFDDAQYLKQLETKYGEDWRNKATKEELRILDDKWLTRDQFQTSHWEEPDVFAHVRLDDRVGPNGEKILFVEELQSDWALEGRKKGFKGPELTEVERSRLGELEEKYATENRLSNEEYDEMKRLGAKADASIGIPPFPFSKNWHEVALKRMLRYAAENGYDQVGWTTGEQQVERYDLSKHLDRVEADLSAYEPGKYVIRAYDLSGKLVIEKRVTQNELPGLVGKDLATRIVEDDIVEGEPKSYSGLDLKIGGEWAYNLYDRMVPQFLNKYAKQWGARVGEVGIDTGPKGLDAVALARKLGDLERAIVDYEKLFSQEVDSGLKKYYADKLDHDLYPERLRLEGLIAQVDKGVIEKVHSLPITPSMKQSVLYEGQPMFRAVDGKPIPQVVNEESVRAAFGGADEDISVIKAADGDYIAQTPGGINIRVYQNDGQIVADPDAFMFAYQEPLEGRPIYGEYISRPGQWKNISYDGVARIAKESPDGTLRHEVGHAAFQLALDDAERVQLLKEHGTEEKAIKAYENWEPREANTLFQKVFQFFQNLYRSFFPNAETIFGRMRSGEVWQRPAPGSVVERPAMYNVGKFRKDLQDAWEVLRGAAPTGRPSEAKGKAHDTLYKATKRAWAPETQSETAMATAMNYARAMAKGRDQYELGAALMSDYTTEAMKLGYDEQWKLNAKMERNGDVRQWNPYKMVRKKLFDGTHKFIDRIKEGGLGYREFYARHLCADPDAALAYFSRPGASRGWEKHGHYLDWDELRAHGIEPFFDNIVQNDQAAYLEQCKYIAAADFFDTEEAAGRFIRIDKEGKPAREVPDYYRKTALGVFRQGWADPGTLDVIHNHFIGDKSNIWFTKYRNLMTAWNIMHVAVGAFHAMTSTASFLGTGFAKGIPDFIGAAFTGDHVRMAQALKNIGPMGVVGAFRLSKQLQEARLEPGKHGPQVDNLLKIVTAGGIIPHEKVLPGAGLMADNLTQLAVQLKKGEIGKAARSSIYLAGKPIMGMLVPTLKYASNAWRIKIEWDRLQDRYNKKYGTNWSPETQANFQKDMMAKSYNERVLSDRIFGEIHPDNLHWSRALANGFKAVVAFPSWNLGTMGWIGSMIRGVAKTAVGKPLDYQAKLGLQVGLGLLVTTAIANTMMHMALNNGQAPEDWQDVLIGARTGRYLNNGSPERVTIASIMKDVMSLAMHMDKEVKSKGAFGVVTGPVQYAKTKFQAPFQMFKELEQNADYYGKEIFPEKGDFLQRTVGGAAGFGKWLGKHAIPFAGANIMTGRSPIAQYGPLVGIRPVPRYLLNTEAMNRIDSILSKQSPKARSAEAMENSKLVADLKQLGWNGQQQEMEEGIQEARANKQLSTIQIRHIRQAVSKDMRVAQFEKMKQMEDAIDVYSRGTLEERKLWRRDLVAKWSRTSPDKKRLLREEYMAALALPISEEQPERVPPRQPVQSGFSILNQ